MGFMSGPSSTSLLLRRLAEGVSKGEEGIYFGQEDLEEACRTGTYKGESQTHAIRKKGYWIRDIVRH